jgi:RNA polymerase sigma-70 factor (ECF subfamily)
VVKAREDPRGHGEQALALGVLYRRYAGWLWRTLRRRYGQEAADDLVQETYLRLAGAMTGRPIRYPKALLSSVASNLARDQGRRSVLASRAAVAFASEHGAGEPAAAPDQVELVLYKQILASMPDVYRDVYVLNRFAGLTYGQIAEHCDVTMKVVEWRMSQALAHCAKYLRD